MKLINSNQLIKRSNGKLFDYRQLAIHHEHVQSFTQIMQFYNLTIQ